MKSINLATIHLLIISLSPKAFAQDLIIRSNGELHYNSLTQTYDYVGTADNGTTVVIALGSRLVPLSSSLQTSIQECLASGVNTVHIEHQLKQIPHPIIRDNFFHRIIIKKIICLN